MTETYRVWLDDEDDAEHAQVFTSADDAKQCILDNVRGHDVYTDFAYLVHDGFADPSGIEIIEGDWRDRANELLNAAREDGRDRD